MTVVYREKRRPLRGRLAVHRVRLAVLERRIAPRLVDVPMELRGELELARERLAVAPKTTASADLEPIIQSYDATLVEALRHIELVRARRVQWGWYAVLGAVSLLPLSALAMLVFRLAEGLGRRLGGG
jgi:hypothetical protein